MMYGFILLLCHLLPWIMGVKGTVSKTPSKLIALFSGITILPYYFVLVFRPSQSSIFLSGGSLQEFQSLLSMFALLYSSMLLFVFLGIAVGAYVFQLPFPVSKPSISSPARARFFAIFCLLLSLVLITVKFQLSGGLFHYLANIQLRAQLTAGTGYLDIAILPATNFAAFFLIYARSIDGKPSKPVIFLVIFILTGSLLLFGGRKAPLMLLLTTILISTVYFPKLKLFSPSFILVYLTAGAVFVAVYEIRLTAQGDSYRVGASALEIVQNLSYIDTYLFILQHFSETQNSFWYGATFPELFLRFVPGAYYRGAPPLDDGVYIRTLFEGWPARPGMSYADLYQSSYPPESFGWGYMNFGVLGIMGFGFIKGVVSGITYRMARNGGFHPMGLFVLIQFAIGFHLTNLRIFQSLVVIIGVSIFTLLSRAPRVKLL